MRRPWTTRSGAGTTSTERTGVTLDITGIRLAGDLAVPEAPRGVVLFAHGSGSGRHSPRNQQVGAGLRDTGYATLLLDLLSETDGRIDAADRPDRIGAVVPRGGRPDLAGAALGRVRAPTLLIVGGADHQVLELDRQAAARLTAEREITVIPGVTHLFPEEGALEQVIDRSVAWLARWLPPPD